MKLKRMAATATLAVGIVACDAAMSEVVMTTPQARAAAPVQAQGTPLAGDEQPDDESEDLPRAC